MNKKIKGWLLTIGIMLSTCMFNFNSVSKVKAEETVHAYYRAERKYDEVPNTFTITFKVDNSCIDRQILFSNYAGSSSSTRVGYISLLINEEGYLRLNWNNEEVLHVFESKDFRTNNWEHITVVRDKENKCFKLYSNGVLLETKTGGVGTDNKGIYAPAIGNDIRPTGTRYPFTGKIADVAVYTKALSESEVLEEYNITDKTTITKIVNPSILYNWVLDDNLNDSDEKASKLVYDPSMPNELKDYSGNDNDCYLCTSFHFYSAPSTKWWEANEDEYTFVFYPDIQDTVDHQKTKIYKQNQWVADHAEEMNLQAVLTLGDLTNASFQHWNITDDAFNIFDEADVPYVLLLGNHDYDNQQLTSISGRDTNNFNEFFPYEDFKDKEWFVEAQTEGKLDNVCYKFETKEVNYLVFTLDFGPSDATMAWASSILDRPEYADYRAIILSHNILGRNGYFTDEHNGPTTYGFAKNLAPGEVNNGQDIYDKLISKHDNVFLAAGGHVVTDTIMRRLETADNGNKVLNLLIDGQSVIDAKNGKKGATLIAVCKINEKTKKMTFNYYDPTNDLYFCVENQFEYDFSSWFSKDIVASEGIEVKQENSKPGETVEFELEVDPTSTKYAVVASDKLGNSVSYTSNNGTYSLVMPETSLKLELVQINENALTLPSTLELDNKGSIDLSSYLIEGYDYYFNSNEYVEVIDNVLTPKKVGSTKLSVSVRGLGIIKEVDVNVNEHICNFNQKIEDDKYFKDNATCEHAKEYYYSCACGNKNNETFEVGDKQRHTFDQKVVDAKYLATEATCEKQASYYYSCSCGEKGLTTFVHGELEKHSYSHSHGCYEQVCTSCHQKGNGGSHNFGKGVVTKEATTEEEGCREYTCEDCGATLKEVLNKKQAPNNTTPIIIAGSSTVGIGGIITIILLVLRKRKLVKNIEI